MEVSDAVGKRLKEQGGRERWGRSFPSRLKGGREEKGEMKRNEGGGWGVFQSSTSWEEQVML